MIIRYDSIAALRADCIAKAARKGYFGFSNFDDNHWFGETKAETLRYSELGDTRQVPEAELLTEQLNTALETPRKVWNASVVGNYCVVPDYIAGRPQAMRVLAHEPDEHTPITIVAVTSSSASISARDLNRRGVAILAFALALARVRPVFLHVADIGDGVRDGETIVTAQINTSPLDLATACYVFTSTGFTRRLLYTICHNDNGSHGGWPPGYYGNYFGRDGGKAANKWIAELYGKLGLDPAHSLIIDAARANDELITNPVPWIQRQIERFVGANEEEGN